MNNYEKQNFTSGQTLKAEHLNHIENGIEQLLPITEENNKQLIIDENGNMAWAERQGYSYYIKDYLCPEKTSFSPFLNLGACFTKNPIVGETYEVICNGTVYEAICKDTAEGLAFGNLNLMVSSYPATEEPFCILGAEVGTATVAMVDQSVAQSPNSLAVRGKQEIINVIPGKYIAGGVNLGTGAESCAVNNLEPSNASGLQSFAANRGAASNTNAFAINMGKAEGWNTFAHGHNSVAAGSHSHAEGYNTIARGAFQHVEGKCNVEDTEGKYAHIVGNGSNDIPSNAYTLDWSGNGWFAGDVEGNSMIVKSSTEGSNKRFKITVDDSGAISATEIVE